jgi:hypothetical protein
MPVASELNCAHRMRRRGEGASRMPLASVDIGRGPNVEVRACETSLL